MPIILHFNFLLLFQHDGNFILLSFWNFECYDQILKVEDGLTDRVEYDSTGNVKTQIVKSPFLR